MEKNLLAFRISGVFVVSCVVLVLWLFLPMHLLTLVVLRSQAELLLDMLKKPKK